MGGFASVDNRGLGGCGDSDGFHGMANPQFVYDRCAGFNGRDAWTTDGGVAFEGGQGVYDVYIRIIEEE